VAAIAGLAGGVLDLIAGGEIFAVRDAVGSSGRTGSAEIFGFAEAAGSLVAIALG